MSVLFVSPQHYACVDNMMYLFGETKVKKRSNLKIFIDITCACVMNNMTLKVHRIQCMTRIGINYNSFYRSRSGVVNPWHAKN